jgi:Integrase core domain
MPGFERARPEVPCKPRFAGAEGQVAGKAEASWGRLAGAFGPRRAVRERPLSNAVGSAWHRVQHEPQSQLLGQCPTESLVATLKKELVHQERYATRDKARRSLFEYVEEFYNRQRRHSALAYQAPETGHNGRNGDERRGGLGERGRVSPKSNNNRGAAAPRITNYH